MSFEPVRGVRLYETVVRQILDLIATGEITPGSQLPPERELAARLGVSRNVLREAFRVLEVRGIVHSRQGGGRAIRGENIAVAIPAEGVVLRLEAEVIADILEARELLEIQVARLAATRAGHDEVKAIEQACGGHTWADNIAFHTAIAAATGNFMLERLVRLQLEMLDAAHQRDHYRSSADARRLLAEHRTIAAAIAAADPDAAEAAVRKHFQHTRAAVAR